MSKKKKHKGKKLKPAAQLELLAAIMLALIITVLNSFVWKIEFWGKDFYILEKSIDVGLWYFGILLTLITIIHQGSNEKIDKMRKHKTSINRLNFINQRAVLLSLIATVGGIFFFSKLSGASTPPESSFVIFNVFLFVWIWLFADLLLFLIVFYNLFKEK